ncbi:MAG: hypothetical protein N2111_10230 [Candidatus Sumerlaeaceae bacterium]|nr:hypothetical protein [Candidatus Sumerlaeaceae bacterium]
MKLWFRKSVVAVAVALAGAASAQTTEDFSGLTATSPPAGTSSIAGGTWAEPFTPGAGFDAIGLVNNPATDLPRTTDSKYIQTSGTVDSYLDLQFASALAGTGAGVLQYVVPIRVDLVAPTLTNNDLDVIRLRVVGTGNLSGMVVVDGVFRLANTNGLGATQIISTDAFDASKPVNPAANVGNRWDDGVWRAVLVRHTLAGGGAGAVKIWVLNCNSGLLNNVVDSTGLSNTNTAGLGRIGFGATFAAASSQPVVISIDNVSIFSSVDYPSESAFLAAAQAYYGPPARVRDWSIY